MVMQIKHLFLFFFLMLVVGQDTLLCQTSFASVAEESVQVHFTGKNHWVCSSSVGGYVQCTAASRDLTSSMKVQSSECYKSLTMEKKLEVELPPAQIQREESIVLSLPLPSLVTLEMEMTRRKLLIARAECASI